MDLVSDFIFDDMCEDIFPYLDDICEDIFPSPKYIMEDYNLSKEDASKVFWAWIGERGVKMTEHKLNILEERLNDLERTVNDHQEVLEKINNILDGALIAFENLSDLIDNIYARIKATEDAITEVK